MIRYYMVSTCIHIYFNSLYEVCGVESVTQIVDRSVCHSHPLCIPIYSY